jgi:prolyl-tRNA editing enzyme YbaK/EbsC (Cys-tRNA(Pro) deacylase)
MGEPFEQVIALLDSSERPYQLIEHGHAVTSMDTVRATGLTIHNGAKSILFKTADEFKLVIVRGDHRADFKKLRHHFAVNRFRMATPEEVLEVMRVAVGACYPFGAIAGVDMIIDHSLTEIDELHFSPGTHNHHIIMLAKDYLDIVDSPLVDVELL